MEETAKFGDIVVLAVKGTAGDSAVTTCGVAHLAGKLVLDATNPIADAPPEDGVLKFFTGPDESLTEKLQKLAPAAHFVKAFSCVGNAQMVNPSFGGTKPTMWGYSASFGEPTAVPRGQKIRRRIVVSQWTHSVM